MEGGRLSALCVGYEEVVDHVEYIFHVMHPCGWEWKVRRRYSELHSAHVRLCLSLGGLPPFPPKGIPGLGILQGKELAVSRVAGLQRYLEGALARDDAARHPVLQGLLGVLPPVPLSSVRVQRWLPQPEARPGLASVELQVLPADRGAGGGPIDRLVARTQGGGAMPTAAGGTLGSPLRVDELPRGEVVDIEVRAVNAVGVSAPVSVRVRVPGRRMRRLEPGMRVKAVWNGDGGSYDATVQELHSDGHVLVNWLRPAPLSMEVLTCVCEAGGDDTTYRLVPRTSVEPLGEGILDAPLSSMPLPNSVVDGGEDMPTDDIEGAIHSPSSPQLLVPRTPRWVAPPDAAGAEATTAVSSSSTASDAPGRSPRLQSRPGLQRLGVRLSDDQVGGLEWSTGDDLAPLVDHFVAMHHLRPLFAEPLLAKAEFMERSGQSQLTVDIIDLMELPGKESQDSPPARTCPAHADVLDMSGDTLGEVAVEERLIPAPSVTARVPSPFGKPRSPMRATRAASAPGAIRGRAPTLPCPPKPVPDTVPKQLRSPSPPPSPISSLGTSPAPVSSLGTSPATELSSFRLGVQLSEKQVEELRWRIGDELGWHVDAFVAKHRLRPLFSAPLLVQAELMQLTGCKRHNVDIVDLMEDAREDLVFPKHECQV